MNTVKTFTNGINRVFSASGGVMWERLNDFQLRQFLMAELDKFTAKHFVKKRAALNIGKQSGSEIYVFSESVQVRVATIKGYSN